MINAYLQNPEAVLSQEQSSSNGLSSDQAAQRLATNGANKLIAAKKKSMVKRFLEQLVNPMIIILIAAAIVSAVTAVYAGEPFTDVIIILTVVIINAVLGVLQESKAEKAIEALQEIAAATSTVLRDGHPITIKSEELVTGDVILLEAGDAVPADARIIECASMKLEEAALTGESVPVLKTADTLSLGTDKDIALGDRTNMIYMGSTVVYGRGRAVVTATAMATEMGKIADALDQVKEKSTPLQLKLNQLSKILSILVVGICVIIFAINLFRSYPNITVDNMLDTFMVAVSLAVAAIPEGLAAVVTIVLSIGVTKMSKQNAIIRQLTAVETLGCTQIICSDKTGTLTQNKMTVVDYASSNETFLATAMALCTDAELDEHNEAVGEPTECALVNYAYKHTLSKTELAKDYPRIGEAPFDSLRKMMTTVHQTRDNGVLQFTKGAPDELLKICSTILIDGAEIPLTDKIRQDILARNKEMADQALRVLGCGCRHYSASPASYEAAVLEQQLCYIGLVGMIDPIRPEAKLAIDECRTAGIRPIMITGDHHDTATAIALQLGIITDPSQTITGAELNELSDTELAAQIERYSAYARVAPEHKVRIINAWKSHGKITAMTGDGVNDAPAIKNADIGIGMGITGTDVTKNVADMVIADDNFATIVAAVAEGRRIYTNIQKAIQFLLSANLSEVLSIFIATLLGFTLLKPVHLLWINLITDSFPALALSMEDAEADIMKQKPRDSHAGIFSDGLGLDVVVQGVLITAITLASYFIGHYLEAGQWAFTNSPHGTTMAFLTLSMTEIFHSFNMRSRRKSIFHMTRHNMYLWGAMFASLLCTIGVIYIPFLAAAFDFTKLTWIQYGTSMLLAFAIIPLVEIIKLFQRMGKK